MSRRKALRRKPIDAVAPTDAQMAHADYELGKITERGQVIGTGYRRIRQLEYLTRKGLFNEKEVAALYMYRHFADLVDKSLVQDSLAKQLPGRSGRGEIPPYILDADRMVGRYEAAAQTLKDILRAVIVEDKSLSQWAIERAGAIEDCEMKGGVRVCRLKPRQKALAIAQLELKMAAGRVLAEVEA